MADFVVHIVQDAALARKRLESFCRFEGKRKTGHRFLALGEKLIYNNILKNADSQRHCSQPKASNKHV